MEIPLDTWKEISLLLPYNFLALSKELITIYDENWFERKVKNEHSNCKKYDNSWEFLYKRSLKSGKICNYENPINPSDTEGIKPTKFNGYRYSLLTFNGDLYVRGRSDENLQLLDNNVLDAHIATYVKKKEWYGWGEGNGKLKSYLITKSDNQFISCLYLIGNNLAITANQIYQYDQFYGHPPKLIITNLNGCVKMVYVDGVIIIQTIDGSLYKYDRDDQKIEKLDVGPVDKLFCGCAKLMDGSIIAFRYEDDRYGKIFWTKNIITPNNNLRGAILYHGKLLILLDNNVYKVKRDKELKLTYDNVKNIEHGYLIV